MKKIFLLSLLFASISAEAQTTVDSVKRSVERLFNAMKASDSAEVVASFSESAVMQTINKNSGKVSIETGKVNAFAELVGNAPKGALDERITFETVKIDADLAVVWTPYSFYYNGKFTHCGVNSFQLVRINNEWKIQYLIDTRRREGCK